MQPTLVVLAAGMGSRYGGLKQVDGVGPNGEAIIEYSVHDAVKAGFGKVVFIIRKDIETAFKDKIGSQFEGKIKVDYVFQELDSPINGITDWPHREKPWGTAHAMLVAKDAVNEPFAVINADDYYGVTSFKIMADYLKDGCTPQAQSMIGYVLDNTLSDHGTVNRGVCEMNDKNHLTDITERIKVKRDAEGAIRDEDGFHITDGSLVSMNFWGFHPSIFEEVEEQFVEFVAQHRDQPRAEFFIPLFVNRLIDEGKIHVDVLPCNDNWYGVTYQEDKEMVQNAFAEMVANGVYQNPLW